MIRFLLPALGGALLATGALAQSFSPGQKDEIDAMIRAYLLENPEIIVEAMEVLEQRREQQEQVADREMISQLRDEILNDGYSVVAGNPDGDVTLVEFLDYRCGYCKQAHESVKALVEADPNLRYVIKEFPILGAESTYAARAAMASAKQSDALYMAFNDALMTHRGEFTRDIVAQLADMVGLDVDQLEADIDDPAIAENIRRTYALARQLEINGTPGFIIGDEIVRGFIPYDAMREMIEDVREAS